MEGIHNTNTHTYTQSYRERDKSRVIVHTHTHQRGMRAAMKARAQEDTTEDHLMGRGTGVVGKWQGDTQRKGGGRSRVMRETLREREKWVAVRS